MARHQTGVTGQIAVRSQTWTLGSNWSVHIWAYPEQTAAAKFAFSAQTNSTNVAFNLQNTGTNVRYQAHDGTNSINIASSSVAAGSLGIGRWAPIGMTRANLTFTGYLNGKQGIQTTAGAFAASVTVPRISVGADHNNGTAWLGALADAVIWTDTLTLAEMQALAAGANPLHIRPESVFAYFPLLGTPNTERELIRNWNLTATGGGFFPSPYVFTPKPVSYAPLAMSAVSSGYRKPKWYPGLMRRTR